MEMQGTSQFESKGEIDLMTTRIHQNLPHQWLHVVLLIFLPEETSLMLANI